MKAEPELTHGLSANFKQGTVELNRRVQRRFPIGSSELEMVKQLRTQGFILGPAVIDEDGPWRDATFERKGFPCIIEWSIRWRAKAARITTIWAIYGGQCL